MNSAMLQWSFRLWRCLSTTSTKNVARENMSWTIWTLVRYVASLSRAIRWMNKESNECLHKMVFGFKVQNILVIVNVFQFIHFLNVVSCVCLWCSFLVYQFVWYLWKYPCIQICIAVYENIKAFCLLHPANSDLLFVFNLYWITYMSTNLI